MNSGYLFTCVFAVGVMCVFSHPQCLDFRPPFETNNLEFCQEYAEFGCCTVEQDLTIQKRYHRIIAEVENKAGITGCREKIREILCLECHPYAAHVYDAELTQVKKPFPGLCLDYCEEFYDTCKGTIPYLSEDEDTRISAESKVLFCEHNAAPDPDYCFPALDSNDELLQDISREGTTVAGCLCLEEFASQLRNPLFLASPPDATQRIFVAEQLGLVYIYHPNKTRNAEPFMDLSSMVFLSSGAGDEKGFLGMAFHPEYATNRRLFVYFSIRVEGSHKTRLSEYHASAENPDIVDEHSERVLLDVRQPYDNHNGGALFFGVDGYLYLSLGDGGAGGDPQGHGQDLGSLLGKMLRLDVDAPPVAGAQYTVPLDNPFVEVEGVKPEIYAYGLRNAWRCDVDEGDAEEGGYGRGRIICGDVGQNAYEEIDLIKPRRNYGWNTREGFECYGGSSLCGKLPDEELPIYAYPHAKGKSVTGGNIYRGCLNPNLNGKYIYGDFNNGALWTLEEDRTTGTWINSDLKTCGSDVCFNGLTGSYAKKILSFGEDYDGEVYMLSTTYPSSTQTGGKVYKFVDPRRRGDPRSCRSYQAPEPETTTAGDLPTTRGDLPTTAGDFPTTGDALTTDAEDKEDGREHGDETGDASGMGSGNGVYVITCVLFPILDCIMN